MTDAARELAFAVEGHGRVSGLLRMPEGASALYVMAHGAGAGMRHTFLEAMAAALAARGVGTLRYQFPAMERGSRRPDSPKTAHAAVRAAVAEAKALAPHATLFAGGKSFGGRMTSQAQAAEALPGVAGLVFLGFPLHPPGKPATERGDHLFEVDLPMLFLQGTRDAFARNDLIGPLCRRLGRRATLVAIEGGDHGFAVPKAAGRKPAEVIDELAARCAAWMAESGAR